MKTIGMQCVAFSVAATTEFVEARITSGASPYNFLLSADCISLFAVTGEPVIADRMRPSVQPSSCKALLEKVAEIDLPNLVVFRRSP